MANYNTIKEEITTYLHASIPLIIVRSSERERVERMLREITRQHNMQIDYYTETSQVVRLGESGNLNVSSDPLRHIADCFKKNRNSIFALGDISRIGDDNLISREVLNILYLANQTSSTLILITADTIWSRIAQFGMLSCLDYPDNEERQTQITEFIDKYSGRFPIELTREDISRGATLLRGFSEIQIDNILSTTLIANKSLDASHLSQLTQQKSRLFSQQESIQLVCAEDTHVAGLDNLKAWLGDKKQVFFAPDHVLSQRSLKPPKGILLVGVPGCGKSLSARMVANQWQLPLLRFDIGAVYDKWVGESERRMRQALEYIDNVAPCVLWIDEIEKMLATSQGGNETGSRVLGQFLFWLQESSSRVFLVATANDIKKLPVELFRKGRFSEIFFINLPNLSERIQAIDYYSKSSLHASFKDKELEELACQTEGFSYSDIEHAIKDLAELMLTDNQLEATLERLKQEISSVVPISKSRPEIIESIVKWGEKRAIPASK